MQDRKTSIRNGIGFGLVAIIACVFFAFYGQLSTASSLYSICFEREESYKLLVQDSDWYGSNALREQTAADEAEGRESLASLTSRTLSWQAESAESRFVKGAASFEADYYDGGGDATAVLLHAYEKTTDNAARFAAFWTREGYNVLIPGMRGHEDESGESVTTLGYYEQYDLYDLLLTAASETGITRFVLHGEGMGANAALLLCGNESAMQQLAEQGLSVELVVAESACTDLMTLLSWEASRQLSINGFLGRAAMRMTVSQNLGFSPTEVSVRSSVAQMTVPAVFVCGEEAGYIPASWTGALYEACSSEKTLCLVPSAGHAAAWAYGRERYEAAILERLNG